MFTCAECGKKFKTMQALGGHKRAHSQAKPQALPVGDNPSSAAVEATEQAIEQPQIPPAQPASPDDESGIMDSIRGLKSRGLDARQIKDLGYKRQTVDDVFLEDIVPAGQPEKGGYSDNDEYPVVTKGTEMITPEGILKRLTNGSLEWGLRFEGMMLLRAAQRMNRDDIEMSKMQADSYAAMIKPTLEMMEKNRDAQDAAAARARESSIEIAERAAFGVAQDMKRSFSAEMQELKAALPGKPDEMNPMAKMIFSAIQPHMGQLLGQAFSSLTGHRPGAQPQVGQQPLAMAGQPAQAAAPDDAPPSCMKPGEEGEFTEA
ncbi:MAG: C2H2-type zinc finger protein [Chloroflexota bacterium]